MKKFFCYMCKCLVAAVISLIILSLLSVIYYNPPIAIEQSDKSTNFKYISDLKWSFMLEGFGNGKTDNMGYNNEYYDDYSDADIVFTGSSHIEALQVPSNANCVYLLNELFSKDNFENNNFKCLNIGMSGHFFETTASNYQYIASKFKGAKYIIIEVFNAEYSPEVLDGIIEDKFSMPIEEKSFIEEKLQKIPYVRLLYKKINETITAKNSAAHVENPENESVEPDMDGYTKKMNVILGEIVEISAENDVVPIILMHERFWEDEKGNIVMETNETYKKAFKKCCETNGLKVIDVSPDMVDEYKNSFEVSYGFSNSAPGEGHLNKTGHRIVADTVYRYINELEAHK